MAYLTQTEKYQRFLELLKEYRRAAGVTQVVLAQRLGRPQSYVSKYEQGQRRLDVVELLAITEALGVKAEEIIKQLRGWEEATKPGKEVSDKR